MKIANSSEFGKFIKSRRKKLGITQLYLSESSGLSASFISDVERGKPTAEFEKVILLAHLLGIDFSLEVRE